MRFPSRRRLRPIAEKYGLRLIVAFGSQVNGHTHPESDVDVAVLAEKRLPFARQLDLWLELSQAFRADVDLSVLNHAEPLLLYQVARKGRVLYQVERRAWPEFRGYAHRYYWDTQKLRDNLNRYIKHQIRGWHHAG